MTKHNKKRNPVVLYEILVQEISKKMLDKRPNDAKKIINIVKQKFNKSTKLHQELRIFEDIINYDGNDISLLKKIIKEARKEYRTIDKNQLNKEKSILISIINKQLGKEVFSNFVNKYREAASLYKVFNSHSIKERVLNENKFLDNYRKILENKEIVNKVILEKDDQLNKVVLKKFIERFNKEYGSLLKEQKIFLTNLVSKGLSLEFKIYLNEEIGNLKTGLTSLIEKNDEYQQDYLNLMELLEDLKSQDLNSQHYKQILKIQEVIYGNK